MSGYGIFEAASSDGFEQKDRETAAAKSLAVAMDRVAQRFGAFLNEAPDRQDFNDRVALVKPEMMKVVDAAGVMPVAGVMRKVVGRQKTLWQKAMAGREVEANAFLDTIPVGGLVRAWGQYGVTVRGPEYPPEKDHVWVRFDDGHEESVPAGQIYCPPNRQSKKVASDDPVHDDYQKWLDENPEQNTGNPFTQLQEYEKHKNSGRDYGQTLDPGGPPSSGDFAFDDEDYDDSKVFDNPNADPLFNRDSKLAADDSENDSEIQDAYEDWADSQDLDPFDGEILDRYLREHSGLTDDNVDELQVLYSSRKTAGENTSGPSPWDDPAYRGESLIPEDNWDGYLSEQETEDTQKVRDKNFTSGLYIPDGKYFDPITEQLYDSDGEDDGYGGMLPPGYYYDPITEQVYPDDGHMGSRKTVAADVEDPWGSEEPGPGQYGYKGKESDQPKIDHGDDAWAQTYTDQNGKVSNKSAASKWDDPNYNPWDDPYFDGELGEGPPDSGTDEEWEKWDKESRRADAQFVASVLGTRKTATDWHAIGYAAFLNGEPGAPALNAQVMQAIGDMPVGGGGAEIMKAYSDGWQAANIEATDKQLSQMFPEMYPQASREDRGFLAAVMAAGDVWTPDPPEDHPSDKKEDENWWTLDDEPTPDFSELSWDKKSRKQAEVDKGEADYYDNLDDKAFMEKESDPGAWDGTSTAKPSF